MGVSAEERYVRRRSDGRLNVGRETHGWSLRLYHFTRNMRKEDEDMIPI